MSTAHQIADQIQTQIEGSQTPHGDLIGTEADLRARHGISLNTLRQAVRILEHRQVAVMRRGVSGGLYAEQPSVTATANYVAALWERSETAGKAVREDVLALDGLVLRRASERMSVADAARIADLHAQCQSAADPIARSALATVREHAIAKLTGNPVIVLAQAAALRFLRNVIPFEDFAWDDHAFTIWTRKLLDKKISALISGEIATAIHASNEYTAACLDRSASLGLHASRHVRAEAAMQPGSLPVLVSRIVLREIRERGWIAGDFLGQEADLIQKYKVGRNTWRQALSILIEYSAVESRRGGAGGIYVAPINQHAVMETASAWLSRQGASAADGLEVFAAIAPPHAAAIFTADSDLVSGRGCQEISCVALLDLVLRQETSPLLALAALTGAPSLLCSSPSIDLANYRRASAGSELVKRAVLNHITGLL